MQQIPLRLLNFCVRISFQFNEHHQLPDSQDCMQSQNYKYLKTCTSKSSGGQWNSVRLSQICFSQTLYFLLYLLPHRVSVTCQIKKMEQPIHSTSDKYTGSPLHPKHLVEDGHSGVSSHAQNTVLNRYPAPLCCREAIVQLLISAAGCCGKNAVSQLTTAKQAPLCPLPELRAALSCYSDAFTLALSRPASTITTS